MLVRITCSPLPRVCASIFNSINGARALSYETSINQLSLAWRSFWSVNFCWPRCSNEELIPRRLIELEGWRIIAHCRRAGIFRSQDIGGRTISFLFFFCPFSSLLLLAFFSQSLEIGARDATPTGCGFFISITGRSWQVTLPCGNAW